MIPASFDYFAPNSLQEAINILASNEDAKIIAGGQSLVPLMKLRLARPSALVDLSGVAGLDGIEEENDSILIGSMVTHGAIERSELLRNRCPLLPQTATTIADVQIRNRGTIGGSIAHADPAGDWPAPIVALGAEMKAVGPGGERWIQADNFFLGLMTSALEPDEILTAIKFPILTRKKTAYLKAAPRAEGFAVVGIAVCLEMENRGACKEIAIGVTGVTDKAYRAKKVEEKLQGRSLDDPTLEEAASEVAWDVDVIENIYGSKDYRSHLARVFTVRAIQAAMRS